MFAVNRFVDAYNAAADHYDDPANSYWNRFSLRTLEHLAPRRGARLLDAGCGSGAFSVPAAETVGPHGHVTGIDLAGDLLALARRKAAARGLRNTTFEQGDFLDATDARAFDGVVSVFSVFFAADMIGAIDHLRRRLRPEGTLAIAIWGPMLFEPAASAFWRIVTAVRPDLRPAVSPWTRVSRADTLAALIRSAGGTNVHVLTEPGDHLLNDADDWWRIVLGSGFRATVEALTPRERTLVREENVEWLRRAGVRTLRADVVYAICQS